MGYTIQQLNAAQKLSGFINCYELFQDVRCPPYILYISVQKYEFLRAKEADGLSVVHINVTHKCMVVYP